MRFRWLSVAVVGQAQIPAVGPGVQLGAKGVDRAQFVMDVTPNAGYTTTFIVRGATFAEFDVFNYATKKSLPPGFDGKVWLSLQKTKGPSDLYVVSNTWQPVNYDGQGSIASTGWHTHPGHSLITVTAGTLTEYVHDCTPLAYVVGDTFIDPGGDHVHIIRNEGAEVASTIAIQLVPYDPAKANRRIDAPAPEGCAFIQ